MIDFSRANLTQLAIHHVGNKGLGEQLTLSDNLIIFKDDFVKETLLRYLITPFKTDIYYRFKGKADVSLQSIQNCCEDLFNKHTARDSNFIEISTTSASHLYNQSMHPKIAGGELYVAYFKDVMCDGEIPLRILITSHPKIPIIAAPKVQMRDQEMAAGEMVVEANNFK